MTQETGGGAEGGPGQAEAALMDLVRDATVRIHRPGAGYATDGPGQGFLGSGFFIAPSWVLTCAHVAMRGEGREVNVLFRADPYSAELTEVPGVVLAALPESRPAGATGWPAPDLALIQLRRPVEHTCVYVTERSEAMLRGRKVRCVGWAPSPGGGLTTLSGDCEVKGTYGGWADADQQIRLDGDWLEPGMSGGPVVDVARGEVVGVIKSRLDDHQGGTAVGIERLRSLTVPAGPVETESDDTYQAVFHAHDRYHADRHNSPASTERTWADVQSDLPGPPGRVLSPKRRIDLLGRLAEFPPPVSTRNLLALLDGLPNVHARDLRPAPRGWRDGLGSLYDARVRDRDAALELVLRYCMGVLAADRPFDVPSTRTATKSLWEWVKRVADEDLSRDFRQELVLHWRAVRQRRDQEHQRAPTPTNEPARYGERAFVLLELEPRGWERDLYDWRIGVARPTGEVLPVAEDSQGTGLGALPERLAAPLAEAFRRCDEPDSPAVLQVAVVPALFGLDVDNWQVTPDGLPLGVVRPVVVRRSERGQPTDELDRLRRTRWNSIRNSSMQAEVVDCEDGMAVRVPELTALHALAHETVPVLCRYGERPGPETAAGLVRVLEGGFGVALWRRTGEADAVCTEFHRRAADTVAEVRTSDRLPQKIHELRQGVCAGRTETYWSDGIALFYDDPHYSLPGSGQLLEAP
ncbi:trypsin-like peptidase domain-containing protein [Streptomyces sp. NPDC005248]|uniref:VMAP-C domain-containing protein n=1 Tax=unclassified Streptomyces TaxID=2593676 RepID=UPI0036D0F7FE